MSARPTCSSLGVAISEAALASGCGVGVVATATLGGAGIASTSPGASPVAVGCSSLDLAVEDLSVEGPIDRALDWALSLALSAGLIGRGGAPFGRFEVALPPPSRFGSLRVAGGAVTSECERDCPVAEVLVEVGFGDAARLPGFGDAARLPGFGDAARLPGFGDAEWLSDFGDAGRLSGFGDVGRLSGFGDVGRVPGFGDAARLPGFGDAARLPGFGDTARLPGRSDGVLESVGLLATGPSTRLGLSRVGPRIFSSSSSKMRTAPPGMFEAGRPASP